MPQRARAPCINIFLATCYIQELPTSVLRPQLDGSVGSEALQVLRGQGDEVVGVLLQVADGVVLKE